MSTAPARTAVSARGALTAKRRKYAFVLRFILIKELDLPGHAAWLAEHINGVVSADLKPGRRLVVTFERRGPTARKAVAKAIDDVRLAIPDAILQHVGPDLVGLTDLADLLGISRQYMRKLWQMHAYTFPVPVYEGKLSLWHLSSLLKWVQRVQVSAVDDAVWEVAQLARDLNASSAAMSRIFMAEMRGRFRQQLSAPDRVRTRARSGDE